MHDGRRRPPRPVFALDRDEQPIPFTREETATLARILRSLVAYRTVWLSEAELEHAEAACRTLGLDDPSTCGPAGPRLRT